MRRKITIVGAGNVGATAARYCLGKGLGDVVLLDVVENVAKGKALDLAQAAVLEGLAGTVTGTANYDATKDSDLVVVTAGMVRKPGMSRDDLLKANSDIVSQVIRDAVRRSPDAVFLVVSNPVDIMCLVAVQAGDLAPEKVMGLSGVLDGARLCANIAAATSVPYGSVQGMVIGEHGNSMVPLPRLATIGGAPVSDFLSAQAMREICVRTAGSGAEIVALLGFSAYQAPGAAVSVMAEAVLRDSRALLCCSSFLNGQYGASGIFMGVPALIGAGGVQEIIEVTLNDEERAALGVSIAALRTNAEKAKALLG